MPLAIFCAPILAMAVLLPALCEHGGRIAGSAYGAAAILALLLTAVAVACGNVTFLLLGRILDWLTLLWERRLRGRFLRG